MLSEQYYSLISQINKDDLIDGELPLKLKHFVIFTKDFTIRCYNLTSQESDFLYQIHYQGRTFDKLINKNLKDIDLKTLLN